MQGSPFTFPAGRRAKWIVAAVWLIGILVAAGPAQLPTKFSDAEENESTSFLPGDAESTAALEATDALQDGELAPAVIVYRRASGLTSADYRTIRRDVRELSRTDFPGVVRQDGKVFSEPVTSPDGKAAIITANIRSDGEGETILDPIDNWRDTVSTENGEGGLRVKITGGAGYSADAITVFQSINGTLLLAAVSLVVFLLIVIYRSPFFFMIPLTAVIFAEVLSRSLGYGITELGFTINTQASSIMSVLVLGAGTDYALLLVARYREELHNVEDRHEAMRIALRSAGPAIFASAATVIAALLCLTLAKVNGTAGLGPIGALGIFCAALSMLTLLPALLLIFRRGAFWPFVPRYGDTHTDAMHGFWKRVGDRVAARPLRVMNGAIAVLLVFCAGLAFFSTDLTTDDSYRTKVESVEGQELLSKSFPSGATAPTDIVVSDPARTEAVRGAVLAVNGVRAVSLPVARGARGVLVQATLAPEPYSTDAFDLVEPIRDAAQRVDPGTLVGGATAVEVDLREAAAWDSKVIPPLVLVVVTLILIGLLRAVVAPLILIGTVILSFLAALGVGYFAFEFIFDFPGSDPSLPLFAFVFLVALGVDYNIFLIARAREESEQHGTRDGVLRALAVTGGVITSAGIVLAGTFSVLAVLPLVFLTEIGFVVAFGVLLDTFLVRSVLVPAIALSVGDRFWWPSALARGRAGSSRSRTE